MYFLFISTFKLYNFILLPSFALIIIYRYYYKNVDDFYSVNFFFLRAYSYISCIGFDTFKKIIYIRSAGVCGRIIQKDLKRSLCLVILPSGITKVFSLYCFCVCGVVEPKLYKNLYHSKAGY